MTWVLHVRLERGSHIPSAGEGRNRNRAWFLCPCIPLQGVAVLFLCVIQAEARAAPEALKSHRPALQGDPQAAEPWPEHPTPHPRRSEIMGMTLQPHSSNLALALGLAT